MADDKFKIANAFAEAMEEDSLSDGIGGGFSTMSYKGKVWKLRHGGHDYVFKRDDGSTIDYIDVVIVGQAATISKSYYPGGFIDGAATRPVCASSDGNTPDANVEAPQAPSCHGCPHNVFKLSGPRKGKDCSDFKRLAVLLDSKLTTKLLGAPLQQPVFLRVPAASLTALRLYGEQLKHMNFPYFSLVTRVQFIPDKPHPQFTFDIARMLENHDAPAIKAMRNDPMTLRIIGKDDQRVLPLPHIIKKQQDAIAAEAVVEEAPLAPKPKRKPIEIVQAAPPSEETVDDIDEPVTKSSSMLDSRIADLLK